MNETGSPNYGGRGVRRDPEELLERERDSKLWRL